MNFLKETIVVAVIAFLVEAQGVNGKIQCHHCPSNSWETNETCNGTIECDFGVEKCIVAKGEDADGQVKYKKGCRFKENCDNIKSLCGRTGSITCLAAACCNGSFCVPTLLKAIAMPSSSVKPSSSEDKTSSVEQMAMKSSDVLAFSASMHSSALQTTTLAAVEAAATTATKTTAIKTTMMASSKEVIAMATETSMKGSTIVYISEVLVLHTKSPIDARPTCKDSSGMRHVLSPLAIVFVAARLVKLLL